MPQTGSIASGEKPPIALDELGEALGEARDVLPVGQSSSVMMVCSMALSSATSVPGLKRRC